MPACANCLQQVTAASMLPRSTSDGATSTCTLSVEAIALSFAGSRGRRLDAAHAQLANGQRQRCRHIVASTTVDDARPRSGMVAKSLSTALPGALA